MLSKTNSNAATEKNTDTNTDTKGIKTVLVLEKAKVEVMALFSYGLNPCEVLKFQPKGGAEVDIAETKSRKLQFQGGQAVHVFEVASDDTDYTLEFNSTTLVWLASQVGA